MEEHTRASAIQCDRFRIIASNLMLGILSLSPFANACSATFRFVPSGGTLATWDQESAVIQNGLVISLLFEAEGRPSALKRPHWSTGKLQVHVNGVDFSGSVRPVHCRLDDRMPEKTRWILDWYIPLPQRIVRGQEVVISWNQPLAEDAVGNRTEPTGSHDILNRSIVNRFGRYTFDPPRPARLMAWQNIRRGEIVTILDADLPNDEDTSSEGSENSRQYSRWDSVVGLDAEAFDPISNNREVPPHWRGPRSNVAIAGHGVFQGGGGRSSNEGVFSIPLDGIRFDRGLTAMWVVRQVAGGFRPLNAVTFVDHAGRSKTLHPAYAADGVYADGSVALITLIDDGNDKFHWRLNGHPLTREQTKSLRQIQSISLLAKHNGRDATSDALGCFGLWKTALSADEVSRAEAWALNRFSLRTYRSIYVSNQGNDANDGLSAAAPKKTLSAAVALIPRLRKDSSSPVSACVDLRLARGSVFDGTLYLPSGSKFAAGGVDWHSPIHVSAYGQGPRPILRSIVQKGQSQFVVVSALDISDRQRIPPHVPGHSVNHFGGVHARDNRGIVLGDRLARIAIVDCDIRHHSEGVVLDGRSNSDASEILFSRNRIHGTSKYRGIRGLTNRSSGIFIRFERLRCVLSENIWDMNGHIDPQRYPSLSESPATIFSHHQYLSSAREACRVDSIGEYFCSSSNNATMMRSAGGRVWMNAYVDNTIDGYCGDGEPGQIDYGAPASVWRNIHWGGQRPNHSIRNGPGALTAINQGFHLKIGSDHRMSECIFDKSDSAESVAAKSLYLVDEYSKDGYARVTIDRSLIFRSPRTGFVVYAHPRARSDALMLKRSVITSKNDHLPLRESDLGLLSVEGLLLNSRHRGRFQHHPGIQFANSIQILERRTPALFEDRMTNRTGSTDQDFRDRVSRLAFQNNDSPIGLLEWARQGYQLRAN